MIFKQYFKFILLSFLIATGLLCLISVILTYTNVSDDLLLPLVFGVVVISNLIGSTLLARRIKRKGILVGMLFGLLYFIIIYLISVASSGLVMNGAVLSYLGMTVVSGSIGGVVGVNL